MGYYTAIKNTEFLPLATTLVDMESIYVKWNKSEGDKYCMVSLICII